MKRCSIFAMFLTTAFAASSACGQAPFDPANDPGLRFWVKADDLATAGLKDGDPVMEWVDASQYKTIMAPRELTGTSEHVDVDFWEHEVEEAPHLQMVSINGKQVPSVRFDRDFGPSGFVCHPVHTTGPDCASDVDGISTGVDRLYQQNNLAPDFDPTDIHDGSDLTAFVVWSQDIVAETITNANGDQQSPTSVQVIVGKRGTGSSNWEFGTEVRGDQPQDRGELISVTYGGKVVWESDFIPPSKTWQIAVMTIEEADPDDPGIPDPTTWYHSTGEALQDVGFDEIVARNSVPEPLGIGAHSQGCCGELESFIGNIGEIIVLDRLLAPEDQEWQNIETYLLEKYFVGGGLRGDYNSNGVIDTGDFDEQATGIMNNDPAFDLDGDGDADVDDRLILINDIANTWAGDSNFDKEFGSGDLVAVFTEGKFETGEAATWAQGDWDGDKLFGTGDLVFAFTIGGYEQGPKPATAAVPEPSSLVLLSLGGLLAIRRRIA